MISKSEAQPFLERYHDEETGAPESQRKLLDRLQSTSNLTKSIAGVVLMVVYTLLVTCATNMVVNRPGLPINNALRDPNVRYHTNKTITAGMSPFAGGPDEKIDGSWRELMSSISVRVSQEELNNNGNHQESVSLPEHGGNLAWLNVFHQLHCLKMIRKMNYREYYYPNQTEHDARDMEVHINHCIEQLRQAVICTPDTSFTTFVWTHSDPKPVLDVRRFERQCVDWDYFMEGVKPRVVSFEEVDELVNPYLNGTGTT